MSCTISRSLASVFIIGSVLCVCSCAVPLAPGYRILKESREIHFVPGQNPELRIHVGYTLVNSGNSDLNFVDAVFPDEEAFGRENLRVEVDGRQAALESLPPEYQQDEPSALRIAFDPIWKRKQKRDLTIEYAFREPKSPGAQITLGEDNFHLGSRGWFPRLQPPKHFLAPYPRRPERSIYTVRVPVGFMVLARGVPKGRKKEGGEIECRFELRKGDLAPYVVAGRYVTWPLNPDLHTPIFWTLGPMKQVPGPAAAQIMAAWQALEKDFGPLGGKMRVPHIVEAPELRWHFSGEEGPAAVAFPEGALVNHAALALGTGSDRFLEVVSHALAHDWFGDEMYPSPDAALGIAEGLPEYATIVVDEERDGLTARRQRVIEYLRRYDEARKHAIEKPLSITTMHDPIAQRRIALAKAPLLFVALEDACGATSVRSGLRELVSLLRGREVDYNDLRAELEQSTGKKLGELFRIWLNRKGIPDEFRNRYQPGASNQQALK
ncbi:MAG TPA: M1 family aminopeptidase [Candidatus Polarisedimenticolia bacterium]|nr:M1 family aminopeptidase [Candidatus Polarisedimenticolia bacterium]